MPLLNQLNTLETAGLVRLASVQPELEYLFRHALVQDAAYASLLRLDRKQLHLAICRAFEELYPDQTDDRAATLAYHYEKAENSERAAYYFRRAGDLTRNQYANVEALAFYQAAARLVAQCNEPSEAQRTELAELYEAIGDLSEILGQHDAAREQLDRAISLLTPPENIWRARLYRKVANTWVFQRNHEPAFQCYVEAETTLGQAPVEEVEAWQQEWIQTQLERSWLLYSMGKAEELSVALDRVQPALEQYGRPNQQAKFFTSRLLLSYRLHRYLPTVEDLGNAKAALVAAQESGDLRGVAYAYWTLGVAFLLSNDLALALENMQACLQIVERVGDLGTEVRCLTYVIAAYRRQGNKAAMRLYLPRLVKAAKDGQMDEYLATAWANNAYLSWRNGQVTEALEESQAALATWQRIPWVYPFQWQALWTLIGLHLQLGQIAEAINYAQRLIAPQQQAQPYNLHTSLEASIQAWEDGQPELARRHLDSAVSLAQAQGYL